METARILLQELNSFQTEEGTIAGVQLSRVCSVGDSWSGLNKMVEGVGESLGDVEKEMRSTRVDDLSDN